MELSADMISSITSSWSDFQGTEQSQVTNKQFGIDLAGLVNEVFQDDEKRSKTGLSLKFIPFLFKVLNFTIYLV